MSSGEPTDRDDETATLLPRPAPTMGPALTETAPDAPAAGTAWGKAICVIALMGTMAMELLSEL